MVLLVISTSILLFTGPTSEVSLDRVSQHHPLRRPNQYMNLDSALSLRNHSEPIPPIVGFPPVLLQIQVSDPKRVMREDERGHSSSVGTIYPDDRHFVVTPQIATVAQFRHLDYGMEFCKLVLKIPVPSPSLDPSVEIIDPTTIDIWSLDSPDELTPYTVWNTAPARKSLFATFNVSATEEAVSTEFRCMSGAFSTLEFVCSDAHAPCHIDFWQDKEIPYGAFRERLQVLIVPPDGINVNPRTAMGWLELKAGRSIPTYTLIPGFPWSLHRLLSDSVSSTLESAMSDPTLSDPASWRPKEQVPGQLFAERTWLEGAILLGVAYGAELVIFIMCFSLLVQQTTRFNMKKQVPLIVYIWVLFLCSTVFIAANSNMARLAFIDNRNFPGGPSAYEQVMFSIPVDNMGNVVFVIANWLADGLMVSAPSSSIWAATTINFTLPYFCTSLALNIVSTIVIVARLLHFRHRVSMSLGAGYGSQYTTIAAMLVESAAIYSVSSLLFLIPFIVGHPIQNVIAPLLIILRVAQGRAWSRDTAGNMHSNNKSTPIRLGTFTGAQRSGTTLKGSVENIATRIGDASEIRAGKIPDNV
ncbi:hypothetical protein H0H93_000549 [Arthromyces matolae]|nr:hypothetical protein H0H93_000549 [Arthromyces matolae]